MAAGSRADVTAQIRSIDKAFEELQHELERHPLRDDISVCVDIAGAATYCISGGRLRLAAGPRDSKALSSSAVLENARTRELTRKVVELEGELERRACDVHIAFKNETVLADLVVRGRDAFEQNDLPRILSSMLCEITLPSWGGGLPDVEVSGVSSLAKLLWSAWLSREKSSVSSGEQQARDKSKKSWLDEDLSEGWVMLHSVSPGIKERVAVFQNDLERLPLPRAQPSTAAEARGNETPPPAVAESERAPHWMDALVRDLRQAAEQFHDNVAASSSCIVAGTDGPDALPAPVVAAVPHAAAGYGACATAPASMAVAGVEAAKTGKVEVEAGRAPPPRSSVNFL